jgi:hypothetical protein
MRTFAYRRGHAPVCKRGANGEPLVPWQTEKRDARLVALDEEIRRRNKHTRKELRTPTPWHGTLLEPEGTEVHSADPLAEPLRPRNDVVWKGAGPEA